MKHAFGLGLLLLSFMALFCPGSPAAKGDQLGGSPGTGIGSHAEQRTLWYAEPASDWSKGACRSATGGWARCCWAARGSSESSSTRIPSGPETTTGTASTKRATAASGATATLATCSVEFEGDGLDALKAIAANWISHPACIARRFRRTASRLPGRRSRAGRTRSWSSTTRLKRTANRPRRSLADCVSSRASRMSKSPARPGRSAGMP